MKTKTGPAYEAHRLLTAEKSRAESKAGRDIGELPPVEDEIRKGLARENFKTFCETYFPRTFYLKWSPDHLKVIAKIEDAVLRGGLFAMAMPRGAGKTSLAEISSVWGVVYGHSNFVVMIGASETHAQEMMDSVKTELETNDMLLADFPEVCYPIVSLEGIAHRCKGQIHLGESTHIAWTASEVIIATIPNSPASGSIMKVAGITGRIRGMKHKRADGTTIRPSLVIIDDPQTDESAASQTQVATREKLLAGAILGLAGPGKKIAGIMPCTVISPDDMADKILNRDLHPQWQGNRTKMVYDFPTNEGLWSEYRQIREDGLRNEKGLRDATVFYIKNQIAMDEGARVSWEERYNHDEASAIQHAMNLKYQDERAFWSEYQNEPMHEDLQEGQFTPDDILKRFNGLDRYALHENTQHLTAFIDIQQKLLYYCVVGWEPVFGGYIVDYGTYPEQVNRAFFTLSDAKITLSSVSPGTGLEGSILAGLEAQSDLLFLREFKRNDGAVMRIQQCLIDANWSQSTDVVYQYCRTSPYAAMLLPSHGRFVGAATIPFSEYKRKKGDRIGHNWRIPSISGKRAVRHVVFDTNYWKSFIHSRFSVSMGDPGALSLWGKNNQLHRMFAEHMTAEYKVRTEGRGRKVDEWKPRPERIDNHEWDCVVGCAVAASILGAMLPGTDSKGPSKRKKVSFRNSQRKKFGE